MRVRRFRRALVCSAALAACLTLPAAASPQPLETAVFDPTAFPATPTTAFAHVVAAGADSVRIMADLGVIAPGGPSFDPTDPASAGWNWQALDAQVVAAEAAGLTPILCVTGLPPWASDPIDHPSAQWYGRLAEGVAKRYSGTFGTLPRVRYWQAWNEPNREENLAPQRGATGLIAPDLYRSLVNAFARGVKQVDPTNLVIAGSLAPYAATTGPGIAPLTFMKQFLCLTGARVRPRPRCTGRATFDVWSMHPYTWGGPTRHATVDGDVALGDLPAMKTVLDQAQASGRIVSSGPVRFWVTEFSWDTNPPDPGGVPIDLQAHWTAEALYRMWQSGVSLVTWFLIRDQPFPARWQSGLYFDGTSIDTDVPKETFEAFRFPTVAFPETGGIRVWSRTPAGAPGLVSFELQTAAGWVPLASMATDSTGIATTFVPTSTVGTAVRATVFATGEQSLPFSLAGYPDQDVNPFGD